MIVGCSELGPRNRMTTGKPQLLSGLSSQHAGINAIFSRTLTHTAYVRTSYVRKYVRTYVRTYVRSYVRSNVRTCTVPSNEKT